MWIKSAWVSVGFVKMEVSADGVSEQFGLQEVGVGVRATQSS